jgi:hypothetical protein
MRATLSKHAAFACALSLCAFASPQAPPPPVSALDHSWIDPDPPTAAWYYGLTHWVTGPITFSTTQVYTNMHTVKGSTANHPWNPEFATLTNSYPDVVKTASVFVPSGERRVREEWNVIIYHGSEGWRLSSSPTVVDIREMAKRTLEPGASFR